MARSHAFCVHHSFSDAPVIKPMPIVVGPTDPPYEPRQPDETQPPDQPDHPVPDPRPPTPPHEHMSDPFQDPPNLMKDVPALVCGGLGC